MNDGPQYPSYPGPDNGDGHPSGQWPPGYGQAPTPPPGYGQPPPLPGYGQAPPTGGHGFPPQTYGYAPAPPATNGKAVAGLVLGIVSMVFCWLGFLIGIAAIVFSVLAHKEISARPPGTTSGSGLATAGLVTGILGTVIWGGIIALMIWA